MYVKVFIGATIIMLSLISGNVAARKFTNRVDAINDMITGLKLLEASIMYTYDPIPQALLSVSHKIRGAAKFFFREVGEGLTGEYVWEFQTLWNDTAKSVLSASALTEKEIGIIQDFGAGFGSTDAQGQKALFQHTCQLLEMQLEEAMNDKNQKTKICRSIYAAFGILIVILLI